MIIQSARLAASQMFDRDFRSVLWRALGMTIVLLVLAWFGMHALATTFLAPYLDGWPWVATAVIWFLGAGTFIGAWFLIGPVAAVFAGLFLDEVAEKVESTHYPGDVPGTAMALFPSILLAAKFTIVVVAANLLALMLVLLPGINFVIFFFVNAFLLGREYFQFTAMRFRSEADANALRRAHEAEIFMSGLVIAAFMAVPLLNLLTPLFATAMMVHVHKALSVRRAAGNPQSTREVA